MIEPRMEGRIAAWTLAALLLWTAGFAWAQAPGGAARECEPGDDEKATAVPWAAGVPAEGARSRPGEDDTDWFRVRIEARGAFRLEVRKTGEWGDADAKVRIEPDFEPSGRREKREHEYTVNALDSSFQFYTVLEPGHWLIGVIFDSTDPEGIGYSLTLAPHDPVLASEEAKKAREAVERACARLLEDPRTDDSGYPVAVESLVLAALAEGRPDGDLKTRIAKDFVGWLDGQFQDPELQWQGTPAGSPSDRMYEAAIALIGLAEASAAGIQEAKAPAKRLTAFLLAAQRTEKRPEAWRGPVQDSEPTHGGWRYNPTTEDADLSVSGWCLVALLAAEAGEVGLPGLADGALAAVRFALRCTTADGFTYAPGDTEINDIRDSIGALVALLFDEECSAFAGTLETLDFRLPAGTQVEVGESYPFYYWYYGTRASFLRGGKAWQTWRTAMLRQLLRRQKPDGSWANLGLEPGDRYATALGVLILRLCLDEAPAYLKREVKGF
jgi:hypothetical protein